VCPEVVTLVPELQRHNFMHFRKSKFQSLEVAEVRSTNWVTPEDQKVTISHVSGGIFYVSHGQNFIYIFKSIMSKQKHELHPHRNSEVEEFHCSHINAPSHAQPTRQRNKATEKAHLKKNLVLRWV